jgi:peptidyl-prolyl cis-trans isomerase C
MHTRSFGSCLAVLTAALALGSPSLAGMDPAEKARRDMPVAHIDAAAITVGELEDRLAAVPRFQLQVFGDTPDAIRHKFLDQVLVPETLYAIGAQAEHLDAQPAVKGKIDRALTNATLRALRAELGTAATIPQGDVQKYFDQNRGRYDTPERYMVWRILCHTREEAVAVIEAARKDPSIPTFNALARDHSVDKATNQRGGNLGVLTLDGASSEAGLRVDPAIVKAAAAVKDGELVPTPVPESGNFAVVWHRGTIPAVHRSLEQSAAQIRDTLWKEREEAAAKKLMAELRARSGAEVNDSLLDGIDISPSDGTIVPRHRPGEVAPLTHSAHAAPK